MINQLQMAVQDTITPEMKEVADDARGW